MLGVLRRNISKASQPAKQVAFQAIVRSPMEYGSAVFDPYQKKYIKELEKPQRKGARFVKNMYGPAHVSELITELGWQSMAERRRDHRIDVLAKILDGRLVSPGMPVFPFAPRVHENTTLRADNAFYRRTLRDVFELNHWDSRRQEIRASVVKAYNDAVRARANSVGFRTAVAAERLILVAHRP